jgi:PAT family beta-lactamase induction signal transducer AmpG
VLAGQLENRMDVSRAWMIVFGLAGAILVALGFYHARVLPPGGSERKTESFGQVVSTFGDVVVTFLKKPSIWLFVAFIFLFRAGEGQINAMGRLFLLDGREVGGLGLDTAQVGTMYGTFGTICFVVGSILGGRFTASIGLRRALLPLIVIMNLPNAAFLYLAVTQPSDPILVTAALCVEMFGYGFGFVGLTLLMMQEVAPGKYEAAHYAICTAVMNFGLMVPGMISGKVQMALGYPKFFTWALIAAVPALIVSRFLPFRHTSAPAPAAPAAEPAQA